MRALLIGVMAGGIATGCVAGRDAERRTPLLDLPSAGTATLQPETVVLPDEAMDGAVVLKDHVVFPIDAPIGLAKDDVIVSGVGDGFVRRVVSVEVAGDVMRVFTTGATLADAVETASFHATWFESVRFDDGLIGDTPWLTAQMHGELDLAPTIDLRFDVRTGEVTAFELAMTGTARAELDGALQFASTEHWAWGDEKRESSTLFRRAYAMGPVPIVVVARMTTVFGAQAYAEDPIAMHAGVNAQLVLDARSRYAPGAGWSIVDGSAFEVERITPDQSGEGHGALALGLFPRVELAMFGTRTAELGISAQTGALVTYCDAALLTGQQALLQGAVHVQPASLATLPEATLTMFDDRVSLDPIEQCAQP